MKQILIFISLFLIGICTINAQSVTANQMNGRLQMTTVSNVSDSTWSITGYFTNSVNKYLPSNINVNDKFFCQIGANTYVGRISVINSRSDVTKLITFRVICNYPNPPNNIGAIIRATSNGYPVFVDGLPNALQAGIQNYFATLINTNAAGNPCEKTITKTNHQFSKGTPVKRVGGTYVRPTDDDDVPDFIVVDSLTANTFKVSTCGLYTSTLPDGLYWYTSASPGYSLTQDTVKVPLFQVLNDTMILNPIVGFNLMSGGGVGITDGDKGEITVTNDGTTWTVDNGVITSVKVASQTLDSTDLKNRGATLLKLAQSGATNGQVPRYNSTSGNWEVSTDRELSYIIQSSAPSDTAKLWLDNSVGAQEVWQLKQRIQSTWKTIKWYDPIGKVFSPLPPAYILATGQSNMLGYGTGTLGDTVQDARVSIWNNSSSWVTSRIHFAPYRTDGYYNNLAFHFAKKLAQTENRIVRLILQPYPGQAIEYWSNSALAWTSITTAVSASGSGTKTFDAILWHQGESNGDGNAGVCAADACYRDSLRGLINRFNATAWVDNTTKFIAGGLSVNGNPIHKGREDVLKELNSDTLTYTGFADAYGFTGGDVHFTNLELVEFGAVRYWNAYKALPILKYQSSGGGTTNNTYITNTQGAVKLFKASHGYSVGTPIRKAVSGVITKGYSTSVDSFPDFVVISVVSGDTVLVSNAGTYVVGTHGFESGQIYYVDSIGGLSVYPDTNRFVVPVFKAVDATRINIYPIKGYRRKIANDYANVPGGLDADVDNFMTTAAIVNDTIKYALNELVVSLKNNGLWTKIKALYPFVGGTSTTHSYNLKYPTLYQITWSGTVTHNYNGITGNGTNGYGSTGISSANLLTSDNIGVTWVVRNTASSAIEFGSNSGGGNFHGSSNFSSSSRFFGHSTSENPSGASGAGIYTGYRASTAQSLFKNGTLLQTTTGASPTTASSGSIFIGAWNNAGSPTLYSNANQAFWVLHESLTTAQKDTMYTITERFQRRVGRSFLNSQSKRVWTGGGVSGSSIENNLMDDLQVERHGVATGTTDGSGDLTVTFAAAMPDATYTALCQSEGNANSYTWEVHTKTTSSFKIRVRDSNTKAVITATSVTFGYEAKDY